MGADKVIVLDRLDHRLRLAEEFGADHTVNIAEYATPEARQERILELTGGRGANLVMELVGLSALVLEGMGYLTNGGTFLEIGNIVRGAKAEFEPWKLLRGQKIMGSLMYRPHILPLIMDMLVKTQDRVPYHKIVSHRYPLEEVNRRVHGVGVARAGDGGEPVHAGAVRGAGERAQGAGQPLVSIPRSAARRGHTRAISSRSRRAGSVRSQGPVGVA